MSSKYERVIQRVFSDSYRAGCVKVVFTRQDLRDAHGALGIAAASNIGDIIYRFRFRKDLPQAIRDSAPAGMEWIITLEGRAQYAFRLARPGKIEPSRNRVATKIPDATPEIVRLYAPGRAPLKSADSSWCISRGEPVENALAASH